MFTFAIRPGYKTTERLIEFILDSGKEEMVVALKDALTTINAELIEKTDRWQNDEMIYRMKSDIGEFDLSSNSYGCVFIHAPNNQAAIKAIGSALAASKLFEEVAVDHAKYA